MHLYRLLYVLCPVADGGFHGGTLIYDPIEMDDGGSPYGNPPSLIIAVAIMSIPRSPKSNKCSSNWFPMNNRKKLGGKSGNLVEKLWQAGDKAVYFWVVPLNVNKQSQFFGDLFETKIDPQRWMFSGASGWSPFSCKNVLRWGSFTLRNRRFLETTNGSKTAIMVKNSAFKWTTHDLLREVCWSTERRGIWTMILKENHFD